MKHIKPFFENYSLEEIYKPDIDWSLFNFLQDKTVQLSDKGVSLGIFIDVVLETGKCDVYRYLVVDGEVSNVWSSFTTSIFRDYYKNIHEENDPRFEYTVWAKCLEDEDKKVFSDIIKKVQSKYPLLSTNIEPHELDKDIINIIITEPN